MVTQRCYCHCFGDIDSATVQLSSLLMWGCSGGGGGGGGDMTVVASSSSSCNGGSTAQGMSTSS